MSDLQNKSNVLSKEQSKEYAQNVMNDIKSYNILNKSDVPESTSPLPSSDNGNYDVGNNTDYVTEYNPNYDYGEASYDPNYDYNASYDQNYAVEDPNYSSDYNLDYDSNYNPNGYVDDGYSYDLPSNYYDVSQPESEQEEETDSEKDDTDDYENGNLDIDLDDDLDSSDEEEDFTDYLLDGDNISSVIIPASVKDSVEDVKLKNVENVIGKYNDTFDYGKNKKIDDSQISLDKLPIKDEADDINLSALGFKNPFQKNYSEEFVDYLSKRKIKKILHEKYGIDSKEIIEYLYSKAMFHKWSEIALEKWLLNPSNLDLLRRKFVKTKKHSDNAANTISNAEINKETKKNTNVKEVSVNEEVKEIKKEMKDLDGKEKEVVIKIVQDNNYQNKSQENKAQEVEKVNFEKPYHSSIMPAYSSSGNTIKDDLRSVIIEENYRKMQFDLQTEILKSHINDKFSALSTNLKQNLPYQNQQLLQQPIMQPMQQPVVNSYDFFGGKFPMNSNFTTTPPTTNQSATTIAPNSVGSSTNFSASSESVLKENAPKEKEIIKIQKNEKEVKNEHQSINNKKNDTELFKKALSEEVGKVSNNLSNKLNSSINNLNNYVHNLSDALGKKIGMLEKQMSGIANKLQNDENENLDMEERIQNVVSNVKNDLMEKLDSIERNKVASTSELDSKINEIKSALFSKLENELEKNATEIRNKADEIDTKLNAIVEDVETRISDNESKSFSEPQVVEAKVISETIDDNTDVDNVNEITTNNKEDFNDIDFLWKDESENLYDSYLGTNADNNEEEEIIEKDEQEDSLLEDTNQNENSENYSYTEDENNKVNEVIDKSIDDISDVIDSLHSLNVNDDIIRSFEETSEKFKSVK